MLADLLKLAELGRNMELYNSLQMCHERQLEKQQQHHHHLNHNQLELELNRVMNKHHQPLSTQCKPLDLSVKRSSCDLRSQEKKIISNTSSRICLHHQKRRHNQAQLKVAVKNELKQQQEYSSNQVNQSVKLITSSTSPSSCSAQSTSSSSVCSFDANHQLPRARKVATLLRTRARNSNDTQSSNSISINLSNSNSNQVISSETKLSQTINQNGKRQKHKGVKSHLCLQCGRSFSRSDMLTRHSRLHSGLKPYQCGKCKQVFSRSDHLSTHERTHTGEKPYQCEQCAYSACRRDMITRHMRTHSNSNPSSSLATSQQQQQHHSLESSSATQLMLTNKTAGENEEEEDDNDDDDDDVELNSQTGELLDSSELSGLEEDE